MNRKFPFTLFFCSVLLVQMASCSTGAKHQHPGLKDTHLTPGKVISRVTCLRDSTLSYALFLPKNYTPSKRYPLIIAFDPHAAGKLPVDLFSAAAERNGYIIAGSNNSKNGIAFDITLAQYEGTRRDILQRFSIDTNRIYTAGFSGGSRVATYSAIVKGDITGVIGCSAGFPQTDKPLTRKFSYLGVVGNADFNYTEMKALDKALAGAGFVHHLLVFDGTHAWPPASLIPTLFTWLELDAMRKKLKPADENYITLIKAKYQQEIDSLQRNNDPVGEYGKCIEALQFLDKITDVSTFTAQAIQLGNTTRVKKQVTEDDRLAQKEDQLQQYYAQAMGLQSVEWWKAEVKHLNGSAGKNMAQAEGIMYKRVLSQLSLVAYMKANGALKAGDQEKSGYYIRLYTLVDPTNPEAPYLHAGWLAAQGKDDEALKNLNKAVDLGFADLKRLESDPAFAKYKGKQDYESIISRIQNKKQLTK